MITISGIHLYEFSIAVTDLLLCIESVLLAFMLYRMSRKTGPRALSAGIYLFVFLGASSLLGAIFHAFFPNKTDSFAGWLVWMLTAISIGLVASTLWFVNAELFARKTWGVRIKRFTLLYLFVFVSYIFFIDYHYKSIILFYAPPLLMLGVIAVYKSFSTDDIRWRYLVTGIFLSIGAAVIQSSHTAFGPLHLDYNTLYHIVQGIALIFFFKFFTNAETNQKGIEK